MKENNPQATSHKENDRSQPPAKLEDEKTSTNIDNKIIVDFKRKETEAGWIRIMDNFVP